jgi:hypothetical protein
MSVQGENSVYEMRLWLGKFCLSNGNLVGRAAAGKMLETSGNGMLGR